ncbi:MAG TPA: hypothetical protein PK509_18445 [Catalimonadaceae bacterium]|nr:hypothetical protein [Catalimonadaceae bacterium]
MPPIRFPATASPEGRNPEQSIIQLGWSMRTPFSRENIGLLAAPEKEFLKKGKGFPSNNWFAEPDNWWTIDLVPEWRKCPDQRLFRLEWSFAKG